MNLYRNPSIRAVRRPDRHSDARIVSHRGASGQIGDYCTANVALLLAVDPPSRQVTDAVAVPGFVVEPTFHVQDTSPSELALGVGLRPAAADTVPDGQVTFAAQVAPGSVFAVIDPVEPGTAGPGRLTNRTDNVAEAPPAVGRGVGFGVGEAPAAPLASGIP